MKPQSFCNKSRCMYCAQKLHQAAEWGGLEDEDTLSEKIEVSKDKCKNAADQFEIYSEKDGGYFPSIIKEPFFTAKEIRIICQFL